MPTFTGNGGNNTINGTNGVDTIFGLGGHDRLDGRGGNDTIFGGTGNDDIEGGSGDDTLHGEDGLDEIFGEDGNDTITGGNGDDELSGGNNNDTISGGNEDDTISGDEGNDILSGDDGDDEIDGGSGEDVLNGGSGNDVLLGGSGNDTITGGGGFDFIDGGSGTDTAVYSGSVFDYTIYQFGSLTGVVHNGPGGPGSGADGVDVLVWVERLQFADVTIDLVGNNAPIAFADAAALDEDDVSYGSGSASVLDNDFDFDGDTLTATAGVFAGTYGTLTLNADGTYTYVLNANAQTLAQGQIAQDSFTYTVSDGSASDTSNLVFNITGLNDAPVASPDSDTTSENAVLLVDVLANDTDVDDGAVITLMAASAPVGQGTAAVVGNQVQFDPGSDFDDLAVGDSEVVLVSYDIEDEHGATSSSTLTITVTGTNDGPVANPDTDTTGENAVLLVDVLANDTDADNGAVLTVTAASAPVGQGTASVVGNQVQFDPGSDFDDLAVGDSEVVVVDYDIEDEHGATSSSTLTITVTGTNDGPVANPDSDTTSENAVLVVDVLANDTDVDNSATLTVTAASAPVGQGTASVVGNQVEFDPGSDFDDLAVGDSEVVVVSYDIEDEHGATSSSTLTITVTGANDGPVANPDTDTTGENAVLLVDVLANDTDVDNGAVLTVTAASAPAGQGTASVLGNQVQFDPGDDFDDLAVGDSEVVVVSYDIEDEHGAMSSSTITVTVTGTNDGPVANPDSDTTGENAVLLVDVLANDTDADDGATLTVTAASAPAGQGTATVVGNQVEFDPGADFDYLADGESAVVVVSYDIEDEHGAPDSSTVAITVTGTNDAPTIDAGGTDDSGSATELPNNDPNENAFTHTDSGAIAFDDLDLSDTHGASFTPQGGGYLGSFTLDPVNQAGDTVGWNFSVDDSDLDFLDDGETLSQVYTVEIDDGHGGTVTQDVTITLTGAPDGPPEWYIDNSAVGSANTGTQADPFTSIAAFNAAQGTPGGPQVGHVVNLLAGTGTYAEADGINLLDDQILTGVAAGPLRPTIEAAAGDGVNVAQNNTVSGLDIGNTSGADIADSGGSVGLLTVFDVGSSGTGQIVDIDQGGTLDVTLNEAASLGSSGGAIDLAGVGGSFTVSGATTITGGHSGGGIDITGSSLAATFAGGGSVATLTTSAVNFVSNTGAIELGGGFDIVTTSGAGLNATGGGSVTVTGGGNSVTSTTGTAVTVSGTAIGAAGITLESVSVNGAANGVVLANTGAGGFAVTGTGTTDGSGGTILNTTGRGVSVVNANDISLANMTFTNAGTLDLDANNAGLSTGDNLDTNAAIHLVSTTGVLLDNVDITGGAEQGINGNNVTNFALLNSSIGGAGNGPDEDGIHFFNMAGTGRIVNTTISGSGDDNFNLQLQSGNLDLHIEDGSASSAALGSGYLFGIRGSAVANINLEGATAQNNLSGGIVVDASDNATMNVRVANSTSSGNNDQLAVSAGDNSQVDLEAVGNVLTSATGDFTVVSLVGSSFDTGYVLDARIHDNTITTGNGVTADGIVINNPGGGTMNVAVTDNDIAYRGTTRAILVQAGQDGNGMTRATITGNTIDVQLDGVGNAQNGILAQNALVGPGVTSHLDLDIGGVGALANTFTHSLGGVIAGGDIRIRQRNDGTVNLDGYLGGATDTAAVNAYMNGRNNEVSSSTSTAQTVGYTGNESPTFITVTVSAVAVDEDGGTSLVYTFTRDGSLAAALTADFAVTGTADAADFALPGATSYNSGTGLGTVTFSAGSATTQVTLDPTLDGILEFAESAVVDVGNSGIANGSFARAFITNDDAGTILMMDIPPGGGPLSGSPEWLL